MPEFHPQAALEVRVRFRVELGDELHRGIGDRLPPENLARVPLDADDLGQRAPHNPVVQYEGANHQGRLDALAGEVVEDLSQEYEHRGRDFGRHVPRDSRVWWVRLLLGCRGSSRHRSKRTRTEGDRVLGRQLFGEVRTSHFP